MQYCPAPLICVLFILWFQGGKKAPTLSLNYTVPLLLKAFGAFQHHYEKASSFQIVSQNYQCIVVVTHFPLMIISRATSNNIKHN